MYIYICMSWVLMWLVADALLSLFFIRPCKIVRGSANEAARWDLKEEEVDSCRLHHISQGYATSNPTTVCDRAGGVGTWSHRPPEMHPGHACHEFWCGWLLTHCCLSFSSAHARLCGVQPTKQQDEISKRRRSIAAGCTTSHRGMPLPTFGKGGRVWKSSARKTKAGTDHCPKSRSRTASGWRQSKTALKAYSRFLSSWERSRKTPMAATSCR